MKPRILLVTLGLAAAAWVLLPSPTRAGMPQPMCVYYGQARDGYGLPYLGGADVILRRGTHEIARHTIRGSLSTGVNFALYVHLDDGRSLKNYSSRSVRSGDLITIVVSDREGEKTIMTSKAVPVAGQPGELILRDVTAAPDLDGDGLPDPWEEALIANSDGLLHTLEDVNGADDFDGDGVSNLKEYQSGTFPFRKDDYCSVEESVLTVSGRLRLGFLSTAGKTYRVESATTFTEAVWKPCLIGLSDTSVVEFHRAEGNGGWISLYVPIGEPSSLFRLVVE